MKKNNLFRYWPVTLVLVGIAVMAVLVVSSSPAQALDRSQASSLQATVVPPTLPPVTVAPPTVVIPQTGGDTVFVDFFSNWVIWAVLGVLLIVLVIALAARPTTPTEPPHYHDHHDHDV